MSDTIKSQDYLKYISNAIEQKDIASAWEYMAQFRSYLEQTGTPLDSDLGLDLVHLLTNNSEMFKSNADQSGGYVLDIIDNIEKASKKPINQLALENASAELYKLLRSAERPIADPAIEKVLKSLRQARSFEWLSKLCDRFIARGREHPLLKTYYAQALIERDYLNAAIYMLIGILHNDYLRPTQRSEIRGLLGRAYKQIYVNHVRTAEEALSLSGKYSEYLINSYKNYSAVYDQQRSGENYWHGINLIAVHKLAEKDGVKIDRRLNVDQLAKNMIEALKPKLDSGDPWVAATLGEACIALERYPEAIKYFKIYAENKNISSFHLESTIRQLEQVWRISAGPEKAGPCLILLKSVTAKKKDGEITLTAKERKQILNTEEKVFKQIFETNLPGGKFIQFHLLKTIVERCAAVAWVRDRRFPDQRLGTGFLVRGSDLDSGLGHDLYIMTNAHVVYDLKGGQEKRQFKSIEPSDAKVGFEMERSNDILQEYDVEEVVWQSPCLKHDTSLLRLKGSINHMTPIEISRRRIELKVGEPHDEETGTDIAVIGHPQGGDLSLSLLGDLKNMNGRILDYGPRSNEQTDPVYLHYSTPTHPGNSGSPVFETESDNWSLVGLHHAGFDPKEGRPRLAGNDGYHSANEGICIHSIQDAIRKDRAGGVRRRW